jgi:hypothetical protein
MAVGGWPDIGGFYLVGAIDEFQIFGWALTAREVQELYEKGR